MSENFWDVMEQYEKQESGGGGIIAKASVEVGYKVFVHGLGNEESWFPFPFGSETAKKAALEKARATRAQPQLAYTFIVRRDSVKGRTVAWQGDRYFVYPHWTDAFKQVVQPAMKELGIVPGECWLRFAWMQDPSGRQEKDQNGETRTALVAYPAEKYADEAAATKAGQEQAARGSEGGGDDTLNALLAEVPAWLPAYAKELKAKGMAVADIAKDVGLSVELVVKALAS